MYCRVPRGNCLDHVFLVFFRHLHHVEVCRAYSIPRPADPTSAQGICDNFKKQDPCGVLWDPSVGETSCVTRVGFFPTRGVRGSPSDPDRRFQFLSSHSEPPVQVGS